MKEQLLRKIKSMIRRAVVSLSLPDTGGNPIVQVGYLGKTANAEAIWPYGLGGRLPEDAQVFLFNIEGMEENKAGIGTAPNQRKKVDNSGEIWVGNPLTQAIILFKSDKSIEMTNGTGNMTMLPDGSVNINGLIISSSGELTNAAGIVLGTHTHAQGNDSDGNTEVETEVPT